MQKQFDSTLERMADEVPSMRSRPVLLAVSGGVDSMCMADLFLHSMTYPDFAVAHCNFRLRGAESDSDAALVEAWAERHGKRLHLTEFDTEDYARRTGMSIEMAARELRYGWFAQLAEEYGYSAVAVAHNANDNAETLMLNLLRGTGIRGLSGMREVSVVPCAGSRMSGAESHAALEGAAPVPLIRPMLAFTRKQIEGYAFSRGILFHEDSTNAGTEYKRNRIRNQVFPVFSGINPSFVRTVCREMGYFSQVCDIADAYFEERLPSLLMPGKDGMDDSGCSVSLERLRADPHWKYLLYRIMERYGFNSSAASSAAAIISDSGTVGGKSFRSENHELLMTSTGIVIRPLAPESRRLSSSEPIMVVRGDGDYHFNGVSFSVETVRWDGSLPLRQPQGVLVFDRARMDFPFICRRWMSGDWMKPLGLRGRKKLSDLFTDLKYGLPEKEAAIVLLSPPPASEDRGDEPEHHVKAVLGVRIDDSVRITGATTEAVFIRLKPADGRE